MNHGYLRHQVGLNSSSALLALACFGTMRLSESATIGKKVGDTDELKLLGDTANTINLADPTKRRATDIGDLGLPRAIVLTDAGSSSSTLQTGRHSDVMLN